MAKKKKKRKVRRSRKKTRKAKKSRKKTRKTRKTKKSRKKTRKAKKSRKRQIFKSPALSKDSEGNTLIKVSDSWSNQAYVNDSKYKKKYKLSIKRMKNFELKKEKNYLDKKYTKIKDVKYSKEEVKIKWYYDGTLNVQQIASPSFKKNANKTAIIWVGDDPSVKKISYRASSKCL